MKAYGFSRTGYGSDDKFTRARANRTGPLAEEFEDWTEGQCCICVCQCINCDLHDERIDWFYDGCRMWSPGGDA